MNLEYMKLAFEEAQLAFEDGEVPIGSVIVKDDKIIATSHNQKEQKKCATEHAEILAIRSASEKINNWRLDGCDIYITLDPCPMCASAIKQARIRNVYSAIQNSDISSRMLVEKIFEADSTNPSVTFYSNLDVDNGKEILRNFFEKQRKKEKNQY